MAADIDDNGDTILYVPFDSSGRSARLERRLPSGSKVVTDHDAGLTARFEVREAFDWDKFTSSGRELNDDDVVLRHRTGGSYVAVTYQDFYDTDGCVTRSQVRLVEEYAQARLMRAQEFERDVEVPEHLCGTHITEEEFLKE